MFHRLDLTEEEDEAMEVQEKDNRLKQDRSPKERRKHVVAPLFRWEKPKCHGEPPVGTGYHAHVCSPDGRFVYFFGGISQVPNQTTCVANGT